MTDGHERCSDSVLLHIVLYIGAVKVQFVGRDQNIQGRVLFRPGILLPREDQLVAGTEAERLSPGIELGRADYAKDARDGEIVTTPRFCIRRVAIKFAQCITRRARVGIERDQRLCPLQSLGAIDRLRDGLISPRGGLESTGRFLRNNCDLAAAGQS